MHEKPLLSVSNHWRCFAILCSPFVQALTRVRYFACIRACVHVLVYAYLWLYLFGYANANNVCSLTISVALHVCPSAFLPPNKILCVNERVWFYVRVFWIDTVVMSFSNKHFNFYLSSLSNFSSFRCNFIFLSFAIFCFLSILPSSYSHISWVISHESSWFLTDSFYFIFFSCRFWNWLVMPQKTWKWNVSHHVTCSWPSVEMKNWTV